MKQNHPFVPMNFRFEAPARPYHVNIESAAAEDRSGENVPNKIKQKRTGQHFAWPVHHEPFCGRLCIGLNKGFQGIISLSHANYEEKYLKKFRAAALRQPRDAPWVLGGQEAPDFAT
ncbi:MAG TPA: hypothetical protein PKE04_10055 [Clostridia bacterium]|nr:hypothetical protein [Clostridia bacterium]